MNNQQAAIALLRRLDLHQDKANVLVNEKATPSEFTVLVFSEKKRLPPIETWEGHPVHIIFTGVPPQPQRW